jgi:gliding motility-associated-like protein
MARKLRFLALLVLLLTAWCSQRAKASHAAGGELLYQWVSDSTWKFTFKFYRDCGGINEPDSVQLCYFNTCDPDEEFDPVWLKKSAALPGTGAEVSPGCPNYPTTCNGGTLPGYIEFWYEGTVTLPYRCNKWVFTASISARNTTITNINNGNLHIIAELNNTILPYNSSVQFTNKPVPYVCVSVPFSFNNGALDPDGDALTFASIQPLNGNCGTQEPQQLAYRPSAFTFGTPNVNTNPFNTNNTFNVNAQNGTVSFTPYVNEIAAITIKVDEYRNGVWIGSTMRDIQVIVRACNFAPPASTVDPSSGNVLPNGFILACPNKPFSFCFDLATVDAGALLKYETNIAQAIPAATLTLTSTGANSARACVTWNSPGYADVGLHTFTITTKDTSCRPPGIQLTQTFAYTIYVQPETVIHKDTSICEGDTAFLRAEGGELFTWSVLPGGDNLTSVHKVTADGAEVKVTPKKTTRYVVQSNLNALCKIRDTVTVHVVNVWGSGEIVTAIKSKVLCEPGYTDLLTTAHTKPPPGATQLTYLWAPSGLVNDSTAGSTFAYVDTTTTFIITTWDSIGCIIKDSTQVIVSKRDFGVSPLDTTLCLGDQYILDTRGGVKWDWSGLNAHSTLSCYNCPSPVAMPLSSGTYRVIISDKYDCKDTFNTNVTVLPLPVIVAAPHDTLVTFGMPVTLKATGGTSYVWSPVTGLSNPNSPTPVVTPTAPTTYTVVGRGENGCASTDTARINLDMRDHLYMPTAFSPNRDGSNDMFRVVNLSFQKVIEFRVFDRWGHQVFDGVGSGQAAKGWDGMIDGKDAPLGVYNYIIRVGYPDGYAELLKGNVTLVR